jgi:hypothetical protein
MIAIGVAIYAVGSALGFALQFSYTLVVAHASGLGWIY